MMKMMTMMIMMMMMIIIIIVTIAKQRRLFQDYQKKKLGFNIPMVTETSSIMP